MEILGLETFNIDGKGEELFIEMQVYNSETYDPLNKRVVKTHAILELVFSNISQSPIEVSNPELVIYSKQGAVPNILIFNSSDLENQFPITIESQDQVSFGYDSDQIRNLLKDHSEESVIFRIKDSNGNSYNSREFVGDSIEQIIESRNSDSFWRSKHIHVFDHKIADLKVLFTLLFISIFQLDFTLF